MCPSSTSGVSPASAATGAACALSGYRCSLRAVAEQAMKGRPLAQCRGSAASLLTSLRRAGRCVAASLGSGSRGAGAQRAAGQRAGPGMPRLRTYEAQLSPHAEPDPQSVRQAPGDAAAAAAARAQPWEAAQQLAARWWRAHVLRMCNSMRPSGVGSWHAVSRTHPLRPPDAGGGPTCSSCCPPGGALSPPSSSPRARPKVIGPVALLIINHVINAS
jgi:hypothetical protein